MHNGCVVCKVAFGSTFGVGRKHKIDTIQMHYLEEGLTPRAGLHEEIRISFLPVSHTNFSPDWCFGLLKRKYCKMKIGGLDDIVTAINNSGSPVSNCLE